MELKPSAFLASVVALVAVLLSLAVVEKGLIVRNLLGWQAIVPWSLSSLQAEFSCSAHSYTTEILSLDPLMIYINDFLTPSEMQSLVELGYWHRTR
jgi:hypothetical protein